MFNATGASAEFHWLAEFYLDSTTLRYADEDISIQESNTVGAFYEGRLPSSGSLVRDLGTFLEPHETVQNFDFSIDNSDGELARLIDANPFANRRVRMWIGEGVRKSNYSEVFSGYVAHPNGIGWDEDVAHITVVDQRIRHRRVLPPRVFDRELFPSVEDKGLNQPIPIVYGDWGLSAGSGNGSLSIPVVCTNMVAAQKTFKIADHGLKSLTRVMKNSVALSLVTQVNNICLTDGTFGIDASVAYSSTTDTVSVNCEGIKTINGSLIERPMDVYRNMQTMWVGLTGTDLNVTAYNSINVSGTVGAVVRRFIRDQVSTETLAKGLLNESQVDMRFVGGKYSPKFRGLDLDPTRISIRDSDIMLEDEQSEKADFLAQKDPDRFFANRVRSRFRYDPINGLFAGSYILQVTASVAEVSAIVERPMDFEWYYRTADVQDRVNIELATYTKEPMNVQMRVGTRGLLLNLADQIDLTYDIFTNRAIQIRRIETELSTMTTRISGFHLFLLGLGRWTSDTAGPWDADKDTSGFWCTALGYAEAGNILSLNISRWG